MLDFCKCLKFIPCILLKCRGFLRREEVLRQNPLENRAISGFSGQKSGTRIIVGLLQSFLQGSEILCKHRLKFIIIFISPELSSVLYQFHHSFSTLGVARNDFFLRRITFFFTQSYRSLQYNVNDLGTRILSTCYSNFWWIPS